MSTLYMAVDMRGPANRSGHYHPVADEGVIQLVKFSGGWAPIIQWHAGHSMCRCRCEEHPYRNFDELVAYLRQDHIHIFDEYGKEHRVPQFIEKLKEWNERYDRLQPWDSRNDDTVLIDGWQFMGGDWS